MPVAGVSLYMFQTDTQVTRDAAGVWRATRDIMMCRQ